VRAAPDGYTLGLFGAPSAINATLYDKPQFQFVAILPVAPIVRFPYIMVGESSVPAKDASEFIAYARPIPAKSIWRSVGSGRRRMSKRELFKVMTGT